MKVLATYNIKGGVGKTSTAVNLAYLAARDGHRTLLWDLDPQGAASFILRAEPRVRGGVRSLIKARKGITDGIQKSEYPGLDVLPTEFADRKIEALIGAERAPRRRISRILAPLEKEYDIVVLDCPPSVSLVSENILVAADMLLVPLIPSTLSIRTFEQLGDFVADFSGDKPDVLAFFSMVDRRKRLHLDTVQELQKARKDVAHTAIPALSIVEQMGPHQAPVTAFAPRSGAAWCYEQLFGEITRRAKIRKPPKHRRRG